MTDTLEPPVQSPEINFDTAFDAAVQQHDGPNGLPNPNQQQAAPTPKELAPPVEPPKQEVAPLDNKPKNPWDKLDSIKPAPDKKAEKGTEPPKDEAKTEDGTQTPEDEQSPQKRRWSELRAKETRLEQEIMPEYEKLQARVKELEATPQIPEEVQKRIDYLEQRYAQDSLPSLPEYRKEVLEPWDKADARIESASKYAGLDAAQFGALKEAIKDKDDLSRNKAIRTILASGKLEDESELRDVIDTVKGAANHLHESIWPKDAVFQSKAMEIANAAKGHETVVSKEQQAQKEQQYLKAHDEIYKVLAAPDKLEHVLKDNKEAMAALKAARPATDPMNSAYQAQAGEVLPYLTKKLNETLGELAELRRVQGLKAAAKPKDEDGLPHIQPIGEAKVGLDDALSAHFRGGFS